MRRKLYTVLGYAVTENALDIWGVTWELILAILEDKNQLMFVLLNPTELLLSQILLQTLSVIRHVTARQKFRVMSY